MTEILVTLQDLPTQHIPDNILSCLRAYIVNDRVIYKVACFYTVCVLLLLI